jgi:hypothetical protein
MRENNVLFFQLPLQTVGVTTGLQQSCLDTENTTSKTYHSLQKTNVKQDSAAYEGSRQTRYETFHMGTEEC